MLKTGQAIVNVKQRHHESFQIRPPFVKPDENVGDEELRAAMKKFAVFIQTEASEFENLSFPQSSQEKDNFPLLDPLEKVILTNIIERPFDGVDERTKTMGLHPSQMAKIHESLTQKGFVRSIYIDRKKLFELTESGKTVAKELKIQIPAKKTKGGLEHDYWIHQTVQFLRKQGFQPVCEVNGIDIVDQQASIAVEIETGKSDIKRNILKLKKSRMTNCYLVATDKAVEIKIKTLTKESSFISVFFVKDFFKFKKDMLTSSSS
jgi:DNA-binding MarR family transcriptional regulator